MHSSAASKPSRSAAIVAMGVVLGALAIAGSPPAHADPPICWADAPSDVDGGGPDLVIGLPGYDLPGKTDAGAIAVISNVGESGVSDPTSAGTVTILTADDLGFASQPGSRFGASVLVARDDIARDDTDACADVFVGAPGDAVAGRGAAGRVHVLLGNAGGIEAAPGSGIVAGMHGDPRGPQSGAQFGSTLAMAVNVLAIGEPRRDVPGAADAGRVVEVDYRGSGSVTATEALQGGPGSIEPGDRFGEVLLMIATGQGPLLVVGVPHEDVAAKADAGAVTLLAPDGTHSTVHQDSAGAGGTAEAGDQYGAALADFVTFTTHSVVRLAVGIPSEDVGSVVDAGAVGWAHIDLFWSPDSTGPITASAPVLTQDSAGIPGGVERGDRFGSALLLDEFGSDDGVRQLVASSPLEDVGSAADAGMIGLTRVDESGIPASPVMSRSWTQDSPGVPGSVESGDRFGSRLGSVFLTTDFDDDDIVWPIIVATAPNEDIGRVADAGMVHFGLEPGRGGRAVAPAPSRVGAGADLAAFLFSQ